MGQMLIGHQLCWVLLQGLHGSPGTFEAGGALRHLCSKKILECLDIFHANVVSLLLHSRRNPKRVKCGRDVYRLGANFGWLCSVMEMDLCAGVIRNIAWTSCMQMEHPSYWCIQIKTKNKVNADGMSLFGSNFGCLCSSMEMDLCPGVLRNYLARCLPSTLHLFG